MEGELTTELKLGEAVTDERAGVFTPDKDGGTHTSCGRAAVLAARGAGPSVAKWVASPDFVNSPSTPRRAMWSEGARVAPERPRAGRWVDVEGGHTTPSGSRTQRAG